jgi:glycosyltransferase involved in cell wall biosynthesis
MENEKIKVAFFLPSLETGGAERNVVNLVNNMNRGRYQPYVVLGRRGGDFIGEIKQDVRLVYLDVSNSIGLFFAFVHYFKVHKPDIFISAFPRINLICIAAKVFVRGNVKIIITEHSVLSLLSFVTRTSWRGFFAKWFIPYLAKILYPKANMMLCVSRGVADDLLRIVGHPKKIVTIYNPVIDDGVWALAGEQVSDAWFLDQDIPIIITAGRLIECKDYPILLKAFTLVIGHMPARLVILGDGPEKELLIRLANHMGLSERVAFLGFQKNPYKYMKGSSVFVLSSLQEGFGNVIIEAMACGVPVVSTDCPVGPGEIITSGKNGLLVPVKDPKALASAIITVLTRPDMRSSFIKEGKKRALDFSVDKIVQQYQEVFELTIST